MKERALRIGRPTPLIGVVSEPEAFDPARPAVIILNSGIMHHVGACRLSVKLAREVAAKGLLAARFDYSGIGILPHSLTERPCAVPAEIQVG